MGCAVLGSERRRHNERERDRPIGLGPRVPLSWPLAAGARESEPVAANPFGINSSREQSAYRFSLSLSLRLSLSSCAPSSSYSILRSANNTGSPRGVVFRFAAATAANADDIHCYLDLAREVAENQTETTPRDRKTRARRSSCASRGLAGPRAACLQQHLRSSARISLTLF